MLAPDRLHCGPVTRTAIRQARVGTTRLLQIPPWVRGGLMAEGMVLMPAQMCNRRTSHEKEIAIIVENFWVWQEPA